MRDFLIALNRYDEEICKYEAHPLEQGKVLLYGSSFFRNWGYERARKQWAEYADLQVVNHGFGGATVDELLYYYNRMVMTYQPSAVVLRPGHNDLTRGLSPEEAWFLTRRLITWIQTDFPSAKIAVLEVFDAKNADSARCRLNAAYNRLMREFCRESNIPTIDLNPFFHHQDGAFRDVFVEDGLHLTDDGYAQMAAWLAPRVAGILQN